MKKTSESPAPSGWISTKTVLGAAGLALLAGSQYWLVTGKPGTGLRASLVGIVLLSVAWWLPRDLLAGLKRLGGAFSRDKASEAGVPWWKRSWAFFEADSATLSPLALPACALGLLILGQSYVLRKPLGFGFVLVAMIVVRLAIYLQDKLHPIRIKNVNAILQNLILLAPALPFFAAGAWLMAKPPHAAKGKAMLALGAALWLLVLARWLYLRFSPEKKSKKAAARPAAR